MKKELLTYFDPKSPISEMFRTLRTNIQFMNAREKLKSILITSILPGEGKSWVSANLAVTFAQAGKKVILVDADMRKGRQYSIFGVSPRPGLSNYLSGVDEHYNQSSEDDIKNYIQQTEIENLNLISAGNVPPNPAELLVSEKMINLIEELKKIADIVIVDGPPSQLVTDSLIITRLVDTTVIVSASKQTKKEDLRRLINHIRKVGGRLAGVVVNKIPMSTKKYEQTYYYGSSMMPPKEHTRKRSSNNYVEKELTTTTNNSINVEERKESKLEETQEMLRRINEYVNNEKMNLNNRREE